MPIRDFWLTTCALLGVFGFFGNLFQGEIIGAFFVLCFFLVIGNIGQ